MGSVIVEPCEKTEATAVLSAAQTVPLMLKISNIVSITAKETESLMFVSRIEMLGKQLIPVF
ncbi:hypothetical protein [Buttiauxella noackiae]|uniref:hypothetical protein n=1 Tax=Buttiauxella noackiae TaxID=82992 RepID=UPI0028D904CB|nr:hypothetical protein [Buttiauxella noackiae]